ncbi:hypothetical protein [Streptomyces sp. SID14515]|uniref:hypothetical protein n=1 Tax=Streptomyces sp. SID14515 TaxID=2706074 RepID=UPI0013C74A4E|nr:hypothetical protein [Streptomyces sp. SID14515]NEB42557.1 hypothetical protein [Streptomyces sp. SID14515]
MSDPFWIAIKEQLQELTAAKGADDVMEILSRERNPYGHDSIAGDGFFGGSGGEGTVRESLLTAGWGTVWFRAAYWYAMKAPDGSMITYIEGDIYRGDKR